MLKHGFIKYVALYISSYRSHPGREEFGGVGIGPGGGNEVVYLLKNSVYPQVSALFVILAMNVSLRLRTF